MIDHVGAARLGIEGYLKRQEAWSSKTFGHGTRTIGITRHIEKEIVEVRLKPHDLQEWIDICILAMDGYWRHGGEPDKFLPMILEKLSINEQRKWPPPQPQDHPTEHIKEDQSNASTE